MATMLANRSAGLQGFAAKASRRSAVSRKAVIVRAEEKAVAKVDRSKDTLYFADSSSLKYLDGTLPGDFGFDPLGLLDPVNSGGFINPNWLTYSEVIHGRWAMLGAAGCIAPEILSAAGAIPPVPLWYRSGVMPFAGVYEGYWTDPFSLFFIEIVAIQFAELKRLQDYRNPGSQGRQYFLGLEAIFKGSGNPAYPGGPWFNMFNLGGKSEKDMATLKLKEVKNGRLAMLAMFGYGAQAVITGKGPFENLTDHLSNPTGANLLTNFAKIYGQ